MCPSYEPFLPYRGPYDIVLFQKRFSDEDITLVYSLKGWTKSGFDICDNYFIVDDARKKRLEKMCSLADFVTTCSDTLSSVVSKYNPKVYTIPDGIISTDKVKTHSSCEKATVLWYGNHGERVGQIEHGMRDILLIKDCLEELAKQFSFKLLVVSNSREKWQRLISRCNFESEYREWSQDKIEDYIVESDICVIPVVIDSFSSCKSNNRALEVMLRQVPVLASPIPAYKQVIVDEKNGFLCQNADEFNMNLSALLTSWELRQKIGIESRQTVLDQFLINQISLRWTEVFEDILDEGSVCIL